MIEGKLYKCPDRYLLICRTKVVAEKIVAAGGVRTTSTTVRTFIRPWINYWSRRLNCTVRYSEPNEIFMCLKDVKDGYINVLFGEKQGWAIFDSWLERRATEL